MRTCCTMPGVGWDGLLTPAATVELAVDMVGLEVATIGVKVGCCFSGGIRTHTPTERCIT